ncbi:glycosyltransferase family 2 protein [Candidatus Woesebacteria bacterium]|nr:glycosyltransferase family 2 protein [Candidatus Woesebacteria bacterium]
MDKNKISAIVITKNEEGMIEECLKSLMWCDEIILVDSGSTDNTIQIAKKYGVKVFVAGTEKSFSGWRNRGLKESNNPWILYIDADERVTPELKKEINVVTNQLSRDIVSEENAYAIPRKNIIFGKEFRHCGQSPDYVKRLFRKSELKGWEGELHEEPKFGGKIGHLKSSLVHIKHETITEMVEKTNMWSEIEAKLMYNAHHPKMNILRFASAGLREFWLRFIIQLAFLDGIEGIIYGTYQVFSRLVSYTKLWELQLTENRTGTAGKPGNKK